MKIAIVGLGGSYADYISARVASQEFDEVWGINCIGAIIHVDRTFMMDPVTRFLNTENAGTQTGVAREFLTKNTRPIIPVLNTQIFRQLSYILWKKSRRIRVYVTLTTQLHTPLLMQYGRK